MKIVIADDMEPEVVERIKKFGEVEYKPETTPQDIRELLADIDEILGL